MLRTTVGPPGSGIRRTAVQRSLALALVVGASACTPLRAPARPLPDEAPLARAIDSVVTAPPLHRSQWGILVRDAATGRTLYARDAERHFIPASNTKLVVAAVALGELGPGYRYETRVYGRMTPGDTVASQLLLVASGDPTLSARFHGSEFAPLDSLAAAVAAAGVRAAHELIIDASRFDDVRVNGAWEVGDLPWTFAPPVGAFAIAEGTFAIERVAGMAPAEPARIRVIGGAELQPIAARVRTDTAGARASLAVDYLSRRDTVFLFGTVPLHAAPDTVRLAVTDPVATAGRALLNALHARGVAVPALRILRDTLEAAALIGDVATLRLLAVHVSPAAAEIVAAILQPSQNWIAEQVLKTLGAERRGQGSWGAGIDVERQYLIERVGIDSLAFFLRDASGLSAQNLLSAEAIVQLLDHVRTASWADDFRRGLPQPGMIGSTLGNRLLALEGRVQAKTGTITHVNALSGYLITSAGRELIFAISSNASGMPAATMRQAIDAVVTILVRSGDLL